MITGRWKAAGAPAFLVLILLLGACDSPDNPAPSMVLTDSAGVAIWSLGKSVVPLGLSMERASELILPDSGWVVEADGVGVDTEGERIYVLDEMAPRVLVFSFNGELVGELGGPGEGPGEFRMPVAINVDPVGTVRVLDASRSLVLRWDRAGIFSGQERLPSPYWGPGFEVAGTALFFVRGDQDGETGSVSEVLLMSRGEAVSELTALTQAWVPIETPCGNMPVPRAPAPSITWGGNARYVVAGDWPDYALQVFQGDRLVASLRRDYPPNQVTEDEAVDWIEGGPLRFLTEECGMTPTAVLDATGFVELTSPIDRVTVDPLDRIWVRRPGNEDGGGQVDLLDLQRGYLGSLTTPAFPVAFISGSEFLTIVQHRWGTGIEIWRLEGGQGKGDLSEATRG